MGSIQSFNSNSLIGIFPNQQIFPNQNLQWDYKLAMLTYRKLLCFKVTSPCEFCSAFIAIGN